jgi:hypothetical protein
MVKDTTAVRLPRSKRPSPGEPFTVMIWTRSVGWILAVTPGRQQGAEVAARGRAQERRHRHVVLGRAHLDAARGR